MWPSTLIMYQELTRRVCLSPSPPFGTPVSRTEPVWQTGCQCLDRRAGPKEKKLPTVQLPTLADLYLRV